MFYKFVEKHTPGLLINRKRKISSIVRVVYNACLNCNAYLDDLPMRVKKLKIEVHNDRINYSSYKYF